MPERLVVTPKKSSLTVTAEATEHYVAGTVGGRFRRKSIGSMDLERWEGSRQNAVPMFNSKLKRFALMKEDGTYFTVAEGRDFPKKFPLEYYDPHHRKFEEPIEICNIANCDDVYMNHPVFTTVSEEGELAIEPTEMYFEIKAAALRGNREVKTASASEAFAQNQRYVLSDKSTDKALKLKKRRSKMSAYNLLTNMNAKRRLAVLRALGNWVDDGTDDDTVEEALFSYVDDNITTEQGMTRQKLFVKFANMDMASLMLKQLIQYAYNKHIIVLQRGVFRFDGTSLGSTMQVVEEFFQSPDNYTLFEGLELAVTEKKRQEQAVIVNALVTDDVPEITLTDQEPTDVAPDEEE